MFDISQYSDIALLVLRLALATTFLYHGVHKFKHWNNNMQMSGYMRHLMRFLAIVETLAAISFLTGVLTQIAAIGLISIMLGAIYFKKHKWGKDFSEEGGGWEVDMLIIAMLITVIILGTGSITLL